jgi:SAM-dependent methyltransferase
MRIANQGTYVVLNLGCGTKTSPKCINIDWSIHLRIARNPIARALSKLILSAERQRRIFSLPRSIVVHDLRKGIPTSDGSVDAVYHSHVLEHISRDIRDASRDQALMFLRECHRVLKPHGIIRVVVPEFSHHARAYLEHFEACERGEAAIESHDALIHFVLGQAVRTEPFGTSQQQAPMRWLENTLLGDARKRGHTHMWEYDRFSLSWVLGLAGFRDIRQVDYRTSRISEWSSYALDLTADDKEYLPTSLYMEGVK